MKRINIVFLLVLSGFAVSCAPKMTQSFVSDNLAGLLNQGYTQKVDNFLVIIDGSSSMRECSSDGCTKMEQAKQVALGINQSIDGLKLQSGLHVIGETRATRGTLNNDNLVFGMTDYSAPKFADAVNSLHAGGLTPISIPLAKSIDTLQDVSGKTAVILISDGVQSSSDKNSPESAAAQLKSALGDKVCIFTVLIGDNPMGKSTMAAVAKAGECGFATTGNDIANSAGMSNFVKPIFFRKAGKSAPVPVPAPVSFNLYVKFDFDKDVIRPEEEDNIEEVGSFLAMHSEIKFILEGHTCNMGSEVYNNGLSLRRADSVKRYLVEKFNIEPARLTTVGYGDSRPLESNDTKKGREANRRVMATISK
jgi:OmpA-OmpF porin, OOP family